MEALEIGRWYTVSFKTVIDAVERAGLKSPGDIREDQARCVGYIYEGSDRASAQRVGYAFETTILGQRWTIFDTQIRKVEALPRDIKPQPPVVDAPRDGESLVEWMLRDMPSIGRILDPDDPIDPIPGSFCTACQAGITGELVEAGQEESVWDITVVHAEGCPLGDEGPERVTLPN